MHCCYSPQGEETGFGGYLSGKEAGLEVVPQGRRIDWGFSLNEGEWNVSYASGR